MHVRRGNTYAINGLKGQVSAEEMRHALNLTLHHAPTAGCAGGSRHRLGTSLVLSSTSTNSTLEAAALVRKWFPTLTVLSLRLYPTFRITLTPTHQHATVYSSPLSAFHPDPCPTLSLTPTPTLTRTPS